MKRMTRRLGGGSVAVDLLPLYFTREDSRRLVSRFQSKVGFSARTARALVNVDSL
jgi:hypothetical protein